MSKAKNYKSELVGAFGHPIAENPTIVMQEAAFKATGLNWRYLNFEVHSAQLEDAIKGVRAMNMQGINLTIPHKVDVLKYLDQVSTDASLMGAVNTVRREGDKLIGENTDGKGFLKAINNFKFNPKGKNVIVLGAGGAARAISVELALFGVSKLTIVNRSVERGKKLSELLNNKTKTITNFIEWSKIFTIPSKTDLIINATSIELFPNVEEKPNIDYQSITPEMLVCDVIPNPPLTSFLKEAESKGAKTLNGLEMLVYQGAICFTMWTGIEAPIEVMHKALIKVFN